MKIKTIVAALCAVAAIGAHAQGGYPAKPVKVIVPFPAGGVTDIGARVVAERMGQLLGQPLVIENRPGAGTKLGTEAAIKSPPDGYTLYLSNTSYAILPVVDPAASYDPTKALAPVGTISTYGLAIVVNPALPVKTLGEFVEYARRNPGKLNYGSAGLGSGVHFAGEQLKQMTGTFMVHIPYRSTALAVQDLAGGRLDMTMDGAVKPYVDAGKVRLIAVTDVRRDPRFPDTPTVAEAGLPDFRQVSWLGLFAPVGTPPETIARLNQALNDAVKDPGTRQRLADLGMLPVGGAPADLIQRAGDDLQLFRKIARDTKIKFD
ncbi:MAG: tripartite tricarboxylate transporter substrate binding protein [Burkholderiales bacterium]|nr:tripartite tricarboxylate transporter substrate binding protein [Burkholderiales bacterium]